MGCDVIDNMYDRNLSQSTFLGLIGCLSFIGNLVFVVLIITYRSLLKNAYNTMVLNLAITDMLTGIVIFLTPIYVIRQDYSLPSPGKGSDLFCYLIENQFIAFTLGIVSLYTATLLGIERWYAVLRPLQYRKAFHYCRVKYYICLTWMFSFAANSTHLLETKHRKPANNESDRLQCVFSPWTNTLTREIIGVTEFLVKFLCPVLTMIITYSCLYVYIKRSNRCIMTARSQLALRRVTLMAAVTAAVMTVCWLPNQVYYLLFKFNFVELGTEWHKFTVIFSMFNSCVNPCIFLTSNKVYRHKLRSLVGKINQWKWSWLCAADVREEIPGTESSYVICMKHVQLNDEGLRTLDFDIENETSEIHERRRNPETNNTNDHVITYCTKITV